MSPVIEGTYGPLLKSGAPGAGTTEIQTLDLDATGGTFALAFQGFRTPDISWSATDATLLANINTALQGSAEVQTLTFAGTITGGTFKLRMRGQVTDDITWSSTNNTLVSNIDTALEAISPVGASGVVTAVGSMTSGIGTITLTFAAFGPQPLVEVAENRLTGTSADVSSALTTAGVVFPPIGKVGVVATAGTLTDGIGTVTLTFSGANMAKKVQPLITVAANNLTGTATCTTVEATAGVDADFRGAPIGALATDISNGKQYSNTGTAQAPTWTVIGSQS